MKIGEMFVELGFKSDTTQLNDFIKMVGSLDMSSVMAATGWGALYEAVKKIMAIAGPAGMEMSKFSVMTGMSAQQMDSWSKAAEQAGVSAGVIKQTLISLQTAQFKAMQGGMSADVSRAHSMLEALTGVRITDKDYFGDVTKYYEKIQQGIKSLHPFYARQLMDLLGINEENMLFMKNTEAFAKRNEQQTINTEEVKKLSELWSTTVKLGQDFLSVIERIGAGLALIITPILKLTDAFVNIKPLVAYKKEIGHFLDTFLTPQENPLGLPAGVHVGLPPGVAYNPPVNMNAVFHFNHVVNPQEMKSLALEATREMVLDAQKKLAHATF